VSSVNVFVCVFSCAFKQPRNMFTTNTRQAKDGQNSPSLGAHAGKTRHANEHSNINANTRTALCT
jgi:hypothetical protein